MIAQRIIWISACYIVLTAAWVTLDAIDVSAATSPDQQRRADCMNYFKDHLQQVSGTPFVKECLASAESIPALATRLQAARSPQVPAAAVPAAGDAAAALQRDCERSYWGKHFTCECMRDSYVQARAAYPGEPDFKLRARIAGGCLSEGKIRQNVKAECLRNPMMVVPQDAEALCGCEAAQTYEILRAEPTLVFDSAGHQQLLQQRGRACAGGAAGSSVRQQPGTPHRLATSNPA